MATIIVTQVRENYGTETSPFWKFKCGSVYMFTKTDGSLTTDDVVETLTTSTTMFQEYVIGVEEVAHDYIPQFEVDQKEYEGIIRHYEPRIQIRQGAVIHWKKIIGYDDKDYVWAYNLSDNSKCVWMNDNAKALK